MKEKYYWLMFTMLFLGFLFLNFSLREPEIKIKNVVFEDSIKQVIESKGVECKTNKEEKTEGMTLIEEREIFTPLLTPDRLLYTTDKSSDTNIEKIYWLDIGEESVSKKVKYIQTFQYEENNKKFKVWEYNTENNNLIVTFYHVDLVKYSFVNIVTSIVLSLLVAFVFLMLYMVIRAAHESAKEEIEKKIEEKEDERKEVDTENRSGFF
ncbi:MAG: hypothetical protein KAI72_02600 [Candidatus Pacebacteria bacterium]|nr:hypothetical protein [Candidatus Paceibacterota bacterium]